MANELRSRSAGVSGVLSSAPAGPIVPTYRTSSTASFPAGSGNIQIPAGAVTGDMLILLINAEAAPTNTPATITGWTKLVEHDSNVLNAVVFYHVCQAGDPGTNVAVNGGSNGAAAIMLAYQNAGAPVEKGWNTSTVSATSLTVTPASVGPLSLALYMVLTGSGSAGALSAGSAVLRASSSNASNGSWIGGYEEASPSTTARNETNGANVELLNVSLEIPPTTTSTTLVSDGLADLPTINTTNYAPIMLFRTDNNGRVTKKEVVYVTSHTAGQTTAAVLKGQEGTTDQADWAAGDAWVHGPTPLDFASQDAVSPVAASGAAQTILDVTLAAITRMVLTANCTLTFPAAAAGKSFTLVLVQDATGSRTVTWPGTVKWSGGTTPTLTTTANKSDVFTFLCVDGTNWLGFTKGLNF